MPYRFQCFPALVACVLLAAAGSQAFAVQTSAPEPTNPTGSRAERLVRGLVHPWGLAFLPEGGMLVTERPGRIRYVFGDGRLSQPLSGAPDAEATGQGGMLDIAVAPDFRETREVYVCFTESRGRSGNGTSVTRLKLAADRSGFSGGRVVFRQQPAYSGGFHFGCRIAFPSDGTVMVTLGERNAQ